MKFMFQGVMMSHDNLTWTARTAVHYLNVEKDDKLVTIIFKLFTCDGDNLIKLFTCNRDNST